MITFKIKALGCFLILLSCSFANAQTAFSLSPETLPEVLDYIETAYGEQIEISTDDLNDFLSSAINENNYSEDCFPPKVSISEYTFDLITFSWEAPDEAVEFYEYRSLNLYSGESDYNQTEEEEAIYQLSADFHLFLFNSVCNTEKVSKAQIIIVDKDVMIHLPNEAKDCNCPDSETIPLLKYASPASSGPVLGFVQSQWTPDSNCDITKYILTIDDMTASGYEATAFILHEHSSVPENIYLNTNCSLNLFTTPPSNINSGDPGKYHLVFNNNIRVNIENISIFQNANITLTTCFCDSASRSKFNSKDKNNISSLIYENPIYDKMFIELNLTETSRVSFQFIDMLGKPVGSKIIKYGESGNNQFKIDSAHLTAGFYAFLIEYDNQSKLIKIVKAQ